MGIENSDRELREAVDHLRQKTGRSTEGLRQRPGDQPLPAEGRGPFMHDVLIADLRRTFPGAAVLETMCTDVAARQQLGISRYGRPLQAYNGRDALLDGYQELLDFLVYAIQVIQESAFGQGRLHPSRLARVAVAYDAGLRAAKAFRELMAERDAGFAG